MFVFLIPDLLTLHCVFASFTASGDTLEYCVALAFSFASFVLADPRHSCSSSLSDFLSCLAWHLSSEMYPQDGIHSNSNPLARLDHYWPRSDNRVPLLILSTSSLPKPPFPFFEFVYRCCNEAGIDIGFGSLIFRFCCP